LVGVQIQAVVEDFLASFFPSTTFFRTSEHYPYTIKDNVRLNKGLTLESALLFNYPMFQPDGFSSREVRYNQTQCNSPITVPTNNLGYLDTFPRYMENYIQGASEAGINYKSNGVADGNRGNNDIMAILIRRGREMGVPGFTAVRDAVSDSPSGCTWNDWDSTTCDPASMFKATAIPDLRALYKTPADVELVVGSALSADTVPSWISNDLNSFGLDATQTYLVLGEIDRIMQLDVFGRVHLQNHNAPSNSYFNRFQNDDPLFYFSGTWPVGVTGVFSDKLMNQCKTKSAAGLVQFNTNVQCLPQRLFLQGGLFVDPLFLNFKSLYQADPFDVRGKLNCDISNDEHANFEATFSFIGQSYTAFFCGAEPCFQPSLPYCV